MVLVKHYPNKLFIVKPAILLFPIVLLSMLTNGQPPKNLQFIAYGKIPAWTAVASHWETDKLQLNFYDPTVYPGHADFVSKGLKTGIRFPEFKEQVRHFDSRKYLPFFVYDLSDTPVVINGENYHWAVHVEDYSYTDNTDDMGNTVLRLMKRLSKEFGTKRGLVLLATSSSTKPNTNIAQKLNAGGYPNLTRSQLLSRFGGPGVQLLNPGVTCGYLRLVKQGKEDSFTPGFK